jgi:N-acetylmuramoyl-L-alanine amidase
MRTRWEESPNWSPRQRGTVNAVIVHYTALRLEDTLTRFKDGASGVSAHFVIDRDGSVIQMIRTEHKAWHAGKSELDGQPDVNEYSVGVELVNWGPLKKRGDRFYVWEDDWSGPYEGTEPVSKAGAYWEPYTDEQYESLAELIRSLCAEHPEITRERVRGHSDVCLPAARKSDPGPAFDWQRVLDGAFP